MFGLTEYLLHFTGLEHSVIKLTYIARMMTVGSRPAISAPTRLHRSPSSHMTTKKTLRPSPLLSV